MSQKYQNEKSPILNGQKMSKISEKVQKIRDLEGPTAFRPIENTRYTHIYYTLYTYTLHRAMPHHFVSPLSDPENGMERVIDQGC